MGVTTHHVKFRQNRSNGWGDVAILRLSQMAAAAILDFKKFTFLPADTLERTSLRKPAKFHRDRPIHRWDMANFQFFKMAAVRHLGFVVRVFGPTTNSIDGLYHCAKYGWNRCTGFNNMQVVWFCALGLKTPIYAPKIGGFEGFWPLKWAPVTTGPEKAHPCAETRRMTRRSWKSVQRPRRGAIPWIKKVHLTTKNMWSQNMWFSHYFFYSLLQQLVLLYKPCCNPVYGLTRVL